MSMYRQLWLALMLTTLLALLGSLFASTLNARAYLQDQLRMKNADNASALALSLSRPQVDPIEIELAVAALFDRGHYESIRVTGPTGETIAERSVSAGTHAAPAWFVRYLPLTAPPGEALISDGWKQVGKVSLVSHSRFAYDALWQSTLQMIAALGLAGLLGGILGTSILRRLKRPLDVVIEQARAITERRFITSPESSVPELRQLTAAMNLTVTRLMAMFDEETARLESVRREANQDGLTGLANRAYFMARLSATLESDDTPPGTLMLIRIGDLADINRRVGRTATDQMLRAAADIIADTARDHPDALAARLNGADFALMLPPEASAQHNPQMLLASLAYQIQAYAGNDACVYIGVGDYAYQMDAGSVLSRIDTALVEAEASSSSAVRLADSALDLAAPRNSEHWAEALQRALAQGWTRLGAFPVTDLAGRLMHRECPLRLRLDGNGDWQPAGRFLPMAERLGLTAEIDLAAIALGLQELARNPDLCGLAVNVSGRSLRHDDFQRRLGSLLAEASSACRRLHLEVSETGALAHLSEFRAFCRQVKAAGCKLGLKHFGRRFGQIGQFYGLPLDYLKIDASYIHQINMHQGNQVFLKGLRGIAHGIGLQVLAQGTATPEELDTLRALDFDGATGPAVQEASSRLIKPL
jgi:diguanylate cyclase (GGDEF)-like protein